MVDLIFVVNDARQWHMDNLRLNPSHYSFLRYKLHYNTRVNVVLIITVALVSGNLRVYMHFEHVYK